MGENLIPPNNLTVSEEVKRDEIQELIHDVKKQQEKTVLKIQQDKVSIENLRSRVADILSRMTQKRCEISESEDKIWLLRSAVKPLKVLRQREEMNQGTTRQHSNDSGFFELGKKRCPGTSDVSVNDKVLMWMENEEFQSLYSPISSPSTQDSMKNTEVIPNQENVSLLEQDTSSQGVTEFFSAHCEKDAVVNPGGSDASNKTSETLMKSEEIPDTSAPSLLQDLPKTEEQINLDATLSSGYQSGFKTDPDVSLDNPTPRITGKRNHTDCENDQPKRAKEEGITQAVTSVAFTLISRNVRRGYEETVLKLGGSVVGDVEEATVLVTKGVDRSIKLLIAIGKGLPIVSADWLAKSEKAHYFLDPWQHVITDLRAEQRYNFRLKDSLRRASSKPVLKGYSVAVSENVVPPSEKLKGIITNSGGKFVEWSENEETWPKNTIIVGTLKDAEIIKKLKKDRIVVSSEWIMSGVLKQKLHNDKHKLLL